MVGSQSDSVCLTSLDELAKEFMIAEGMPEAGKKPPPEHILKWRQCENVRSITTETSISAGLAAADSLDDSVLKDQRLLFQMKKQQLLEVLRQGDSADALAHARDQLSALALDAYPEAYAEFKKTMTAFLWPAGSSDGPRDIMRLWEPSERTRLAETLANTLKLAIGARDTELSYVLRYLLLTNRAYHTMDARSRASHRCSSGCELATSLLLPERAERAMVPDITGLYPEAVTQALAQATELTRQEAIGALRRSHGKAVDALRAELGCFNLDMRLLRELVREYAYARDLIAAAPDTHSAQGASDRAAKADGAERRQDGKASMDSADHDMPQLSDVFLSPQGTHTGSNLGRGGEAFCISDSSVGAVDSGADRSGAAAATAAASHDVAKYAAALRIKQLAQAGNFAEVESELRKLNPMFLDNHPKVLLELWLCRYAALLAEGRHAEAVSVARTNLTPLADDEPAMEAQIRKALAGLMTGSSPVGSAAELQESVCRALQLREPPRLLRLLGGLLSVHAAYFAKVRTTDRFEGDIGIAALRQGSSSAVPGPVATTSRSVAGNRGSGNSGGGEEPRDAGGPEPWGAGGDMSSDDYSGDDDGEADMVHDADGPEVTEANILLTMEFTGLPRPQCVELLLANNNDPHAVMHSLFA